MATTTKKRAANGKPTNRIAAANGKPKERVTTKVIDVPQLQQAEIDITLIGDRPLLVNNKMNVAEEISDAYSGPGGKAGAPKKAPVTDDEKYARAFYVLPDTKHPAPHAKGRYGIPASGIKKCVCSAIRTTGINDNTTIGLIGKSLYIMEDGGGLCAIRFGRLERDIRPDNIGS